MLERMPGRACVADPADAWRSRTPGADPVAGSGGGSVTHPLPSSRIARPLVGMLFDATEALLPPAPTRCECCQHRRRARSLHGCEAARQAEGDFSHRSGAGSRRNAATFAGSQ